MHIDMQHLIHHYGYGGIFFVLMLEVIGIPFPAETTLTLSGIEWQQGVFALIPLILWAAFGNIVGSTIAFAIGRYFGRPVLLRYGKYIGITESRLNRANQKFDRYRVWVVLLSKFIAGIRVLVPYIAGMNRMSFAAFSLYNAISALAWSLLFIVLGKYIDLGWRHYHHLFSHSTTSIVIALGIVAVAIIFIRRKRKLAKVNHYEA